MTARSALLLAVMILTIPDSTKVMTSSLNIVFVIVCEERRDDPVLQKLRINIIKRSIQIVQSGQMMRTEFKSNVGNACVIDHSDE